MASLRHLFCAIRGHEEYLHFEPNRVYLQCVACGYQSPGWTVENRRPVLQFKSRRPEARLAGLLKKIA